MKKIIFLGFFLRFLIIILSFNILNYDLLSYLKVGQMIFNKINIYPQIANLHHPYFPFFLYFEALGYFLGSIFKLNKYLILAIIKIIIMIFDLVNIYLVYLLSKKNLQKAFLYAVNPISILIFSFHGQFDAIPLFFLLLAIYLILKNKEKLAILVYSFSIMTKTWPAILIFFFLKKLKNKKLIFLSLFFPFFSIFIYQLLFQAKIIDILKTIISYQGLWGIWGITSFFSLTRIRWQKLTTLFFLLIFFYYSYKINKKNIINQIFILLLFFYVFTTNFSIQYLSWFVPFLTIVKPKYYWHLIFSTTIFLILTFLARGNLFVNDFSIKLLGWIFWFFLTLIYLMLSQRKNTV